LRRAFCLRQDLDPSCLASDLQCDPEPRFGGAFLFTLELDSGVLHKGRLAFSLCSGGIVRSHFKHSIELADDNAEIVEQLAGVQDFMLAKATYDAAVRRWPKARIRLCQEARIIEDSG
jgi:hypothetical protein